MFYRATKAGTFFLGRSGVIKWPISGRIKVDANEDFEGFPAYNSALYKFGLVLNHDLYIQTPVEVLESHSHLLRRVLGVGFKSWPIHSNTPCEEVFWIPNSPSLEVWFLGVDNDLYMTSWRVAPQTLQAKVVEDGEAFLGAVVHAAVVKMPTAQPKPGSESSIWP